jgi:hypothetical protein
MPVRVLVVLGLALLTLRGADAQTREVRTYLVPEVGTGTDADPFAPKYADLFPNHWTADDFGDVPVRLIRGSVTEADAAAVSANADAIEMLDGRAAAAIALMAAAGRALAIPPTASGDDLRAALLALSDTENRAQGLRARTLHPLPPALSVRPVRRDWSRTLPATDTFNRANGGLGANWTTIDQAYTILSNEAVPNNSSLTSVVRWTADTFEDDQYTQAKINRTIDDGLHQAGVCVRMSADTGAGADYYYIRWSTSCNIRKIVNGAATSLASFTCCANNSVVKISVVGTTQAAYCGTTQQTTSTDATHASGNGGLFGIDFDTPGVKVDDFETGNGTGQPAGGARKPNCYVVGGRLFGC